MVRNWDTLHDNDNISLGNARLRQCFFLVFSMIIGLAVACAVGCANWTGSRLWRWMHALGGCA